MSVNYNNFAKTFSSSRKNMKWEEIEYFLSFLDWKKEKLNILDIWCWNWRLLWELKKTDLNIANYLWIDLSSWLLVEANSMYPDNDFKELDMLNISSLDNKYNVIFFIASYHHLNNTKDRIKAIKKAYGLLETGWYLLMTNWSLASDLNKKKYSASVIEWSKNVFWSLDYSIKIWNHLRYYHWFDITELEFLFKKNGFEIIENREFENKKNFVSILRKI